MKRLDLRGRVTLASAAALAAGLAILTLGVNVLIERRLDADASSVLVERADALFTTLEFRPDGTIAVRDTANDDALDRQAWVYGPDGRSVQRPAAGRDVQRVADSLAASRRPAERVIDDRVRLRAEPVHDESGQRRGTVVVGVRLEPYDDTEHVVLLATLALDLFVLLLGTLLVRSAVGRALRPVSDMTQRAADWSEHDLDRRFDLGPPRDELTALSATLDGLLARIGSSMRHEQRFSAEVAHEVRTPLAGVRGEAELGLRRRDLDPESRAAFEQILRGTARMEAVIQTLLATARGHAGAPAGEADAAAAANAAADAVRPTAERSGIELEVHRPADPLRVGADLDLVAQSLQPLLDNAVRHARRRVAVTAERAGPQVVFRVADDGPGLNGDGDSPFEPGKSTAGGSGLGLPLARRLARSCGGDVHAVPDAEGGHFELRLPLV
jgi:two-component system OmpR family sensor kinase